jgi:hypothetical protein
MLAMLLHWFAAETVPTATLAGCASPTVTGHRVVWYAEGANPMKATKALKRLTKIKSLMSVVTERYSASAPHLRKVLKDAADAVARAKHAVRLQASSATKSATAKAHRAAKTTAASQKTGPVKKVAPSARRAEAAMKRTPVKKTVKKSAARKKPAVPVVQAATEAVAQ